jgi:hypothetical protein
VFNLPLSFIIHVLYTDAAHTSLLASSIFYNDLKMFYLFVFRDAVNQKSENQKFTIYNKEFQDDATKNQAISIDNK